MNNKKLIDNRQWNLRSRNLTEQSIEPALETLTIIGNRVKTDKATQFKSAHGYTLVYEAMFAPLRDKPLNLLEFGLCIGGPETGGPASREVAAAPSLELWQAYFPEAQIYGFDISDFAGFQNDRFSFRQGDCGNTKDLAGIGDWQVKFDIIIDDASHASYHQLLTFQNCFDRLKPGGVYIIEDTHWQPTGIEGSLPPCPKVAEVFSELHRNAHWPALPSLDEERLAEHQKTIAGLELFTRSHLEKIKDRYVNERRAWHRSDALGGRLNRARQVVAAQSLRAGLKYFLLDPVKLIIIRKAGDV